MSRPISSITFEDLVGFQEKANKQLADLNGRLGSIAYQLKGYVPEENAVPDPGEGNSFLQRMFVENLTTQKMLESIQLKLVELESIILPKAEQPEPKFRPFQGKIMPPIKDEVEESSLAEDLQRAMDAADGASL